MIKYKAGYDTRTIAKNRPFWKPMCSHQAAVQSVVRGVGREGSARMADSVPGKSKRSKGVKSCSVLE